MDKPKITIRHYKINVRIRCIDDMPELRTKGYPVVLKGFEKYKFAVHPRISYTDSKAWVVTEMSSGIAFNGGFDTRMQAAENDYEQLKTHEEKFIKKIKKFQFQDK